jgi:hypothetical protein
MCAALHRSIIAATRLTPRPHAGLLLLNMVISIISEGLCEILDNDEKNQGAPRCAIPQTCHRLVF